MLGILKQWGGLQAGLTTTVQVMNKMYRHLFQEAEKSHVYKKQLAYALRSSFFFFVPDSNDGPGRQTSQKRRVTDHEQPCVGHFYRIDQVCWRDPVLSHVQRPLAGYYLPLAQYMDGNWFQRLGLTLSREPSFREYIRALKKLLLKHRLSTVQLTELVLKVLRWASEKWVRSREREINPQLGQPSSLDEAYLYDFKRTRDILSTPSGNIFLVREVAPDQTLSCYPRPSITLFVITFVSLCCVLWSS